ncbi:MAG TPA: molybdopterin-binding protein [Solirubrobacterales bacterium]
MRAALLTVSTSKARGEGSDESGARLAEFGLEVAAREVVRDDRTTVEARLVRFCDELGVELVLTSGGTGLSPDDVTPEATRAVLEREAPGSPRRCAPPPAPTASTGCSPAASPGPAAGR